MDKAKNELTRRRVFAGAGAASALAAVAAVLPRGSEQPVAEAAPAQAAPEQGGGYQVTQHVLHYYQTARV